MHVAALRVVLLYLYLAVVGTEKLFGYDMLLDGHTVILTEGTSSEIEEDEGRAWPQKFPLIHFENSDSCELFGWQTRLKPRRVFDAFTLFNEIEVNRGVYRLNGGVCLFAG